MKKDQCAGKCCHDEIALDHDRNLSFTALAWGLLSLLWLAIRTGQKPSRIAYPCQRTALANVIIFLVPAAALIGLNFRLWRSWIWHSRIVRSSIHAGLIACVLSLAGYSGWHVYQTKSIAAKYQELRSQGPTGRKVPAAAGAAAAYLTVPHAMALTSPHRVVSVRDTAASNWTFPCTSSGACSSYYGESRFVDQSVIDQMVARGIRELTGKTAIGDAWRVILPDYQAGQSVAIKVNFNDTIAGGGKYGYADNDAYVDALPQIVNSIVAGLTSIGVAEENIWVYDASRHITDRFRSEIVYGGVRFFDANGNGSDVEPVHYASADGSASIEFNHSSYSGSHRVADLLVYADYLINIPIMKRHGGTGITFSLKNHMGSINGFLTGVHAMHDYIELTGSHYDSDSNPLVDINLNTNIRDKTVLVVGDAIYGAWSDNNSPPERWTSFGNDSPNMLFFSGDPVAVDSVMFDYLNRETSIDPRSEDILVVAARAGLGVHERWNNDLDRRYQAIDYAEIDLSGMSGAGNPSENAHQAPEVEITSPASDIVINVGQTVVFQGSVLDPDGDTPLSYRWDFGTGSGIAGTSVLNPGAVQFSAAGVFTVKLTATDATGLSNSNSRVVTVNPLVADNAAPGNAIYLPSADMTITAGETIYFEGRQIVSESASETAGTSNFGCGYTRGPDESTEYLWEFGEGAGVAPVHVKNPGYVQFNIPGVFQVTLTVTDPQGTSSTSSGTRSITVLSKGRENKMDLLSKANWRLRYADSEELVGEDGAAENAFDGDPSTIWHTAWLNGSPTPPHEIQIDLGATRAIEGVRYLPRQDGESNGRIGRYELFISNDPSRWGAAVATGIFTNSDVEQQVAINRCNGRYIRLRAVTEANGSPWTSIAEIGVVGTVQ